MPDNANSIPPEMVASVRKELRLNHEVSSLRALISEKLEKIKSIDDSISMKEKIGIAKTSYYQKRDEIKFLEESIEKDKLVVNNKIREWKQLRLGIQQQLDTYLRHHDTQYRVSERVYRDYLNLNELFGSLEVSVKEFVINLGQTRSTLSATYDATNQTYSKSTVEHIKRTSQLGYRLDGLIIKINDTIDTYNYQINGTFLQHIKLPLLSLLNVGDIVNTFQHYLIDQTNVRADTILGKCEQLHQRQVPAFLKILAKASTYHTQACHHYVESYWEKLRQQTWQEMHTTKMPFRHKGPVANTQQPGAPVEDTLPAETAFSIEQEKSALENQPVTPQEEPVQEAPEVVKEPEPEPEVETLPPEEPVKEPQAPVETEKKKPLKPKVKISAPPPKEPEEKPKPRLSLPRKGNTQQKPKLTLKNKRLNGDN